MSLLDKASLIVTPNAYNESKLYSVVPNTTLGDMDVVRATTATRVNSAGLIEVVPRNLFTYSEQFDNAAWTKINATVTANATTAPNGMVTADKLIATAVSGTHIALQTPTGSISGLNFTTSVFVKAAGLSRITLLNNQGGGGIVDYNLTTNTFTLVSGVSASIQSLENGWYRCIMTFTPNSTGNFNLQVRLADSSGNTTFTGNGVDGVSLWGFQVEQGSTATEYFPTTTRLNIPRIDYTNGSCPSLLVEPQRTNLLTYSNDFSNISWVKQELTLTANSIISPDGTLNAYKLTPTTVNSPHQLNKLSISASVSNTMSFYAKKGGYDLVECLDGASGFNGSKFNLNTGTFTNQGTGVGSMIFVGNGWYRCIVTVVTTGIRFYINNSSSYIGDGTSGIYLWGTQYETASYPTSYIPTVASTVTRNADVISKTGISSLIGQTEGTVFVDVNLNSRVTQTYFAISSSATAVTDYIGISFRASTIVFEVVRAGTLQATHSLSNSSTGRFKLGIGYKANDFVFYSNGTQLSTDNSGTVPTCNDIVLINSTFSQNQALNYNSVQLYKTRLTNDELAQLTAL